MPTLEAHVALVGGLGLALACGATDKNTGSDNRNDDAAVATSGGGFGGDANATTDPTITTTSSTVATTTNSTVATTTGSGGAWNCDGSSATGSGSEGEICDQIWSCAEGNIGLRCVRYNVFDLVCTCVSNETTFIVHDSLDCAVADLDVVEAQCGLEVADDAISDDDVLPDLVITPANMETAFDLGPMDPAECGVPSSETTQTGCTWSAECSVPVTLDCYDPQVSAAACRCLIGDQYYRPFSVTEAPLDCSAWTVDDAFELCGIPTP